MKDILGIILALFLCALIIWAAYRFSRFLANASGGRFRTKYLRELERAAVSTDARISLFQCGSEYYLLGITKQNISLLAVLNDEQLTELPELPVGPAVWKLDGLKESAFFKKLKSGIEERNNRE